VISWRITRTGWTDCDKPHSDMPDYDTQHDPEAPHLDHRLLASFQCDNPYATILARPNSAEAAQLYAIAPNVSLALPQVYLSKAATLMFPQAAKYDLANLRDLGRPCEEFFNDFPFQWIWLEMMLMNRMLDLFLF
jgi:hypothetical protein